MNKKTLTICAIIITAIIASVFLFAQSEKEEIAQNAKITTITPELPKQVVTEIGEVEEVVQSEVVQNEEVKIDTSNWKTYTNKEYGFSVKYPKGANSPHYKDDGKTIVISVDFGNFILLSMHKSESFQNQLIIERKKCQKWLDEFSEIKKSADKDIIARLGVVKMITNLNSCGFNMGAPKEVLIFDDGENRFVRFIGSIRIDDVDITQAIHNSLKFE